MMKLYRESLLPPVWFSTLRDHWMQFKGRTEVAHCSFTSYTVGEI